MRFQLAKTFEGIKMYGPIYDFGTGGFDKVEEFVTEDVDDWFLDHMVDQINAACDTLLDDGDVDFISAEKCKELLEVLNNLPENFVPIDSINAISVLTEYAKKAIEYHTGIEIEM